MYPNLNAEQARKQINNKKMADILGITSKTYTDKKQTGEFKMSEILALCDTLDCEFNYLFEKFNEKRKVIEKVETKL